MEMHSPQSLYEIHGLSMERRRRRSRLTARVLMRHVGSFLREIKRAIETELAIRRAVAELTEMDDRMLRDLGITRGEIESVLRRPETDVERGDASVSVLSHETARSEAGLPIVDSPLIVAEERPESRQSHGFARIRDASPAASGSHFGTRPIK